MLSLILGKRFYSIHYDIRKIIFYFLLTVVFYFLGKCITFDNPWLTCIARTPLLILFICIFLMREMRFIFSKDFIHKMFHKK